MAKDDKKDVAKAKLAYTKKTISSVVRYPKAAIAQSKWDKSSSKSAGKTSGKAYDKAISARSKSTTATAKFNKVNNERIELKVSKQNAVNKIKANPKILKSPTSGFNRRGKK